MTHLHTDPTARLDEVGAIQTEFTGDGVDSHGLEWSDMKEHWEAPDDLLGGTLKMREKAEKWLPKEEGESQRHYDIRLSRSVLFEGYADALDRIVSKPFKKSVTVTNKEKLPPEVLRLIDNADLRGRSLTQFAKMALRGSAHRGLSHIMVDASRGAMTRADELFRGAGPRFVFVDAAALRKWRWAYDDVGTPILDRAYIHKRSIVPDGEHGESQAGSIQMWTRNEVLDFKMGDGGAWVPDSDPVTHGFVNDAGDPAIPIQTHYTNRIGDMVGYPPLEGLAWLNVVHWQSMSDQRNLLRVARVPKPYTSGDVSIEEQKKSPMAWGVSSLTRSSNPNFRIRFAEVSGTGAIAAGAKDLEDLEAKMERMGMRPFMQPRTTATANRIDEEECNSDIEAWVRGLENVLTDCLAMACRWVGKEMPEDVKVDIFSDFGIGTRTEMDLDQLLKARSLHQIPQKVYLEEVQRRGLISEDRDVDEMIEDLKTEALDDAEDADFGLNDEPQGAPVNEPEEEMATA